MKILYVSSGNSKHGIQPLVLNQGESLKSHENSVEYFTIKGKGFFGYIKNIKILKQYLKKHKFDIIHAHYASFVGWVSILAASKIPVVISVMGSDAYGRYNLKGRRCLRSYPEMLLTQLIQPFASGIIVKSKNILGYIRREKKTYLVPNGVNFKRFFPQNKLECRMKLGLPLDKKLILFLANPEKIGKNFKLLSAAASFLKTENFEIINPFPIENKLFPLYLNACDVFVLTSFNEGSPNVIKEAMACNVPIVSTDVGDVKEVITDTEGCFIISYDPLDVANKIDKALAFNMPTKGRENIGFLESGVIANKLISIYREVITT